MFQAGQGNSSDKGSIGIQEQLRQIAEVRDKTNPVCKLGPLLFLTQLHWYPSAVLFLLVLSAFCTLSADQLTHLQFVFPRFLGYQVQNLLTVPVILLSPFGLLI